MNKLIHKGYFKEIFRQLRVIGVVGAVILMLANLTTAISVLSERSYSFRGYSFPNAQSLASPMMFFVYVMGCALTFAAFGWLNKRSTSDFYHAIPVTRTQEYFSSLLAIMIWMFIGLTAYTIVHALVYLILGAPFNYLLFLCIYVNMLIAALEVVGAACIACAISGTRFVNLIATVVILFLPRFLTTVILVFMSRIDCPSLVTMTISPLFDPTYNIIATPYMSVISIFDRDILVNYANVGAMIYTLVYSAILVLVGWVAFKKRRSEAAGIPTTNRFFQGVIRTAAGLPFLLILAFLFVNEGVSTVTFVVLFLLAFIFYCLYELISTKSAKKMLKAMPLFIICIAISALFVVLPRLIVKGEYAVKVNENNVKSFRVDEDESEYAELSFFYGYTQVKSYTDLVRSKVSFDDPESIAILAKAYERCNGKETKDFYTGDGMTETVVINRKGRDITRNVCFTASEYAKLQRIREGYPVYANAASEFPKGNNWFYATGLDSAQSKEIGEVFREEFEALSLEKREALAGGDFLVIYGCLGTENYSSSYSLTEDTPRASELYIKLINEQNGEEAKRQLKYVLDWMESGNGYLSFSLIDASGNNWRLDRWMMQYEDYYYDPRTDSYIENTAKPIETDPEFYSIIKLLYDAPLADSSENAVLLHLDEYFDYTSGAHEQTAPFNGYFALRLSGLEQQLIIEYYRDLYSADPDYGGMDYFD